MTDTFDITQQPMPNGQGVNKPASGTYGEGAALDRLKAALPDAQPSGPGAETGAPVAPVPNTPRAPSGTGGGVPSVVMGPSTMPDVPAMTPLGQPAGNPVAEAQTWRQRNLAVLDALANDPTKSSATREWASQFLDKLIRASAQ